MSAVEPATKLDVASLRLKPLRNKEKEKEKEKEKKVKAVAKQQAERLKTIVRRLPPNLPEEIFWQSVQKWVSEETVQWKAYHKGKFKTRLNKENIPSRAYIAFKDEQQLAEFGREYDGHMFRDKNGNEFTAVVEFAPFQKIPTEKKKIDSKMGTIEKDEDYISFLESLKETATKTFDAENLESLVAAAQPPPHPTTTPLLEALKAEKSAQKDKEAILRNHAHYKDPAVAASSKALPKDHSKKKGDAGAPAKPTEQGKKAPKKATKAAQVQAGAASGSAPAKGAPTQAKQTAPAQPAAPKAPRPPRERQPKQPTAHPAAGGASFSAPSQSETAAATATGDGAAQPAPRRARPMLGLASRQFEAALSEAGVTGSSKPRREREKSAAPADGAPPSAGPAGAVDASVSPKGKGRAEKRAAPGAPMILQRDAQGAPKILARPVDGVTEAAGGVEDGASAGRGRGRGRGRG